jgi:hypothetical protein
VPDARAPGISHILQYSGSKLFEACSCVVLYTIVLFSSLGIVPLIHGAYQISCDPSDPLEALISVFLSSSALRAYVVDNAGVSAARLALGLPVLPFPKETMLGAMASYVSVGSAVAFQPMNANFGIIPPLEKKVKGGKAARNDAYAERAIAAARALGCLLFKENEENA